MELVRDKKPVVQTRRRNNLDGSITIQQRLKPEKVNKVIVARGTGEHTIGNVMTSPLIPFRKSMILQLNRRGFNTDNLDFKTLVALYYNEFVSNKENEKSPFVPISQYEFRNNPAFRLKPSDNFNGDLTYFKNSGYFEQVNDVVDRIINVFVSAKNKKAALTGAGYDHYQALTDEEELQARTAERVESHLESSALEAAPMTAGNFKNIVFWVVMVAIFVYIFN